MSGDTLYAGYFGGLAVFDISDPALAELVTTVSSRAATLALAGANLFVGIGDNFTPAHVDVYDIAIPTAPVQIASLALGGASLPDLDVSRTTLYAMAGASDLRAGDVDLHSLRFGPGGAAPQATFLWDADRDGLLDVAAVFRVRDAGIGPNDTEVCVSGESRDGTALHGCDAIRPLAGSRRRR